MKAWPIPDTALDDRLGFIGTSGSGKTYCASSAVERLLGKRARVVIVDPLGVWWGLRLLADGRTQSDHDKVAIFGGPHGDLPLNEHAGALIGEVAATAAESCIIDLSQLGTKSSERRFMTAFLDTIYRKATGEPFHLVIDEADLFAPQRPPKGDETLLNLTEQIVRRGRVKGFIPWLISQRPAVINKNVLSQVDGLVAFKLTSTQDRDALDAWIEGQADKAEGKAIKDSLPVMRIGQGVVWIPGRGLLETVAFPPKATFDSSRTPKRGEKARSTAALKPLDLGALRGRLATVEAETKANDPRGLRAQIADLQKQLTAKPKAETLDADFFWTDGFNQGKAEERAEITARLVPMVGAIASYVQAARGLQEAWDKAQVRELSETITPTRQVVAPTAAVVKTPEMVVKAAKAVVISELKSITGPQQRVLDALGWWQSAGVDRPTRTQVAAVARYSPSSGGFANLLGTLRTGGYIDYPGPNLVTLTEAGATLSEAPSFPMSTAGLHEMVLRQLSAPQQRVLRSVLSAHPDAIDRAEIAQLCDYSPSSGGFANLLGSLRSLGFIDYPGKGSVRAEDILFLDGR